MFTLGALSYFAHMVDTDTELAPFGLNLQQPGLLDLTQNILSSNLIAVNSFPSQWADYRVRRSSPFLDDVERDFPDVYPDMRQDARVESNLTVLRMSLINQGIEWDAAVPEDDPLNRYRRAMEARDMVARQLDSLEKPFEHAVYESTLAMPYGHHLHELVWITKNIGGVPQNCIQFIDSKPRDAYHFALDPYNHVLGVSPNDPTKPLPIKNGDIVGTLLNGVIKPDKRFGTKRNERWPIYRLDKFWVQTWDEEYGNIIGRSLLRAAYHPWWFKQQVWTAYLLYMAAYSSPAVVAIPPENKGLNGIRAGNAAVSKQSDADILAQLQKIKMNAAGIMPPGWEIKLLQAVGDGSVFRQAIDQCNQEITEAILWQTLMTSSQHNMTRSAGEVHQDVFDSGSVFATNWLSAGIRRGVAWKIIANNMGEETANELTPIPNLGQIGMHNFAKFASSVSVLENSNWFTRGQRRHMDRVLGLPAAKAEEEEERGARNKPTGGMGATGDNAETKTKPSSSGKTAQQRGTPTNGRSQS